MRPASECAPMRARRSGMAALVQKLLKPQPHRGSGLDITFFQADRPACTQSLSVTIVVRQSWHCNILHPLIFPQSANPRRYAAEEVRPIFWANRPKSYLGMHYVRVAIRFILFGVRL